MKFHNRINVIEDPTSAASLDPIKIPLCAYVEEEEVVEEPSQIAPAVNQTENKAFLDPHLGTVFPFHFFYQENDFHGRLNTLQIF